MLLLCAIIWGFAFSAQRTASGHLSAISFNGLRFFLAVGVLLVTVFAFDFVKKKKGIAIIGWNKDTLIGGAICGVALFIANNLQQYGVSLTSVGKASFITTLYIVIVPVLALLMRRRPSIICRFAILVAVVGFYLMCMTENLSVTTGDFMVLLCAFVFSFQILFIDIYAQHADPVKLTFVQFLVAAIISVPAMAIDGFPAAADINASIISVLYVGILSAGVAFTLQTAGQQRTEPAIATLLMSLESVFGLIGGVIILYESPTVRELAGCLLVFIAVFMAQLNIPKTFLQANNRKYFIN